jgi:hypothetical protein
MKRHAWFSSFVLAGVSSMALAVEEDFCTVPQNCTDDVLSIRFTANGASTLPASVGDTIEAFVALDVKTLLTGQANCSQPAQPDPPEPPLPAITECTHVEGFSYGVKHDMAILNIVSANTKGMSSFMTQPACGEYPCDPATQNGVDFKVTKVGYQNLGFIQAVVVTTNGIPPLDLPREDGIKLAVASYKVRASPCAGSKIAFSNDIQPPPTAPGGQPSPPTAVNITTNGKSKQPKKVNNALVTCEIIEPCLAAADYGFYFGPSVAGAQHDIASQTDRSTVKVTLRNKGVALGFSLGIKKAADKLTFESTLGSEAGREVDLVITKADGAEVSGAALKGNTARGAGEISFVDRSAALAANSPGDFLGVDMVGIAAPDVGGPGVTVGYVADVSGNGHTIPAVADTGGVCGGNEVLILKFGHRDGFTRADANGDGRINVTDGVLVAQNIFAGQYVFFDCKEMLDVNDDGALNVADPVFLVTYIFLHGPAPAAPFRSCGTDATADALTCSQPNCI